MSIQPARRFNECPWCREQGKTTVCHWRHGLHFEHEMLCPTCWEAWDPHELWDAEEEERAALNTSRE